MYYYVYINIMITLVTVTSQGQISIPAKVRRLLGFKKGKAILRVKKEKIELEPEKDISKLRGVLKEYGKKNADKNINEIIASEENAVGNAIANRYKNRIKK